MFEVGRVCIKLAGRDAGMKCVVVEVLDGHMVLVDGETRRRKCNVKHLEPTDKMVKISSGASSDAVHKELGVKKEKKAKKNDKKETPKKTKAKKSKPVKVATTKPKAAKPAKEEKKQE